MATTPIDSVLHAGLFGDPALAALFDDRAVLRAMLDVEAALARVQGRLGIIPADAAARIDAVARSLEADPAVLAAGTASAGVPVPALVTALRAAIGDARAAGFAHWGATSQDVVDTGLVLRLRTALAHLERRLGTVGRLLGALADRHRRTPMVARTRGQQAVPTSFGLKVAGWLAPLLRSRERLSALRPRLLVVSLGGAGGTLSVLGDRAGATVRELAAELDLGVPDMPWHVQRDGIAELAGWLALVTGGLGKLAGDVLLMAQNEVGELREGGGGGGSSTMPQKSNPVMAEALVACARMTAVLLPGLHQALPQAHERDGAGWQVEWLALPQMVVLTGAALARAETLLGTLVVDTGAMRRNLDAGNGLVLAEAATFALAVHLPRDEAAAAVADACAECARSGRHLVDLLAAAHDLPVDWRALRDPAAPVGAAEGFIDAVLARLAAVDRR